MRHLRRFEQFVAVAEERSFIRAAKRLNMAQPPLTVAIRALEEEFGIPLLLRNRKFVKLTVAGEVFLREARITLAQAEQAIWRAKNANGPVESVLRISFVGMGGKFDIIPRGIRALRQSRPELELVLTKGTSGQQMKWLRASQTDVALLVGPVEKEDRFYARVLRRSRFAAALPDNHKLAHPPGDALPLIDLSTTDWICFRPTKARA